MRIFIILLLSSLSYELYGQQLRPKIKRLVHDIEKVNELHHESTGIGGTISNQYQSYKRLSKVAKEDELLELLKHQNPVVRGYASWSLIDNEYRY